MAFWYRVDHEDCFAAFSEAWNTQVTSSDAQNSSEHYVGRKIWSCMSSGPLSSFLQSIFYTCRILGSTTELTYRCDLSDRKRLFTMRISGLEDGSILVLHKLSREATRPHCTRDIHFDPQSNLHQCGVCEAVLQDGAWRDVSAYSGQRLTVGAERVCPECRVRYRHALERVSSPNRPAAEVHLSMV